MTPHEIQTMNSLMKSLEKDVLEMQQFNKKLKEIIQKKEQLAEFYQTKWMDYYDNAEKYEPENLQILNQDSLWNALSDTDYEAKEIIRNAVKLI